MLLVCKLSARWRQPRGDGGYDDVPLCAYTLLVSPRNSIPFGVHCFDQIQNARLKKRSTHGILLPRCSGITTNPIAGVLGVFWLWLLCGSG